MTGNINWQETLPKYRATRSNLPLDISATIREKILSGNIKPGTQLPGEADLAKILGVSRSTLRSALNILHQEGTIIRRHGVGTFVTDQLLMPNRLDVNLGVTELMHSLGLRPSVGEINISTEPADKKSAELLQVPEDTPLVILDRVRMGDEHPVVYSVDKFALPLLENSSKGLGLTEFENLIRHNLSLYKIFEDDLGIKISYGLVTLRPTLPDNEIQEKLRVVEEEPLMYLFQTDFDEQGQPLIISEEYHVSDVYTFTVHRKR